ncbi:MAG: tRNA-intron lyase [Candidatus Hodarchaeota archaeon]
MEEEEEITEGVLIDNNVIVSGEKATATYEAGYYGSILEEEKLGLEIVEALLLIERKRLKVLDEKGQELDFQSILKGTLDVDPRIWTKYLVYRDLRSRGYIVRLGYGSGVDFRVYERGAVLNEDVAKYLIHVVVEGAPLELASLEKIIRAATSSRKKLVLGVVDRQGETTYYFAAEVNF